MVNQFFNKKILLIVAIAIIGMWVAPYFILGEDAHMRVHDNLDSNIAWYQVLKESGQLFSPGETSIPQIMNGELTRNAFYSEYYMMVFLFMLFPPMIAYGISQLITRAVAFLGMYLLLKDYVVKGKHVAFIEIGVALLFALTPYWPSGALSILGMPLALWAFLKIRNGQIKWYHFVVLTILPFLSSFVLGFFYFLSAMGIFWLIDTIRTKKWNLKFFGSIIYMLAIYVLIDYRLVISMLLPHEPTNRDVFYQSKNNLIDTIQLIFKNYIIGHNQDRSIHEYVILPISLIVLLLIMLRRQWKDNKLFISLNLMHFLLSTWYAFWFYEGWQPLKERISILSSFNFSRYHYFSPILVYAMFAYALKWMLDRGLDWSIKKSFIKKGTYGLIFALMSSQFLILLSYNEQIYYQNSPSFREFYAEEQFREIKDFIGKSQEDYKVVSIGIHPAIAQFNGFYTIDTYNNIYPLEYKKEFRKIIEQELEKSKTIRDYYDHWGGRVYIFTEELGKQYMFSKRTQKVIENLELNTEQLIKMGGEYIFSAVPIMNASQNHLILEKVFTHDNSNWKIYLYSIKTE